MTVGAVAPIGGGTSAVYALSPYLNGVTRVSDAVALARAAATAPATQATPVAAAATPSVPATTPPPAAAPFANPAIEQIAAQAALAPVLATPVAAAPTLPAPTDSVLYGDGGRLVQAYGAVALLATPLALGPIYLQPTAPAIPPVAPLPRVERAAGPLTG